MQSKSNKPKRPKLKGQRKRKEIPKLPKIETIIMQEGDQVIGYFNPKTQILFNLKSGKRQDTKYGHYDHDEFIGKPFSSKVKKLDLNIRLYHITGNISFML